MWQICLFCYNKLVTRLYKQTRTIYTVTRLFFFDLDSSADEDLLCLVVEDSLCFLGLVSASDLSLSLLSSPFFLVGLGVAEVFFFLGEVSDFGIGAGFVGLPFVVGAGASSSSSDDDSLASL